MFGVGENFTNKLWMVDLEVGLISRFRVGKSISIFIKLIPHKFLTAGHPHFKCN